MPQLCQSSHVGWVDGYAPLTMSVFKFYLLKTLKLIYSVLIFAVCKSDSAIHV